MPARGDTLCLWRQSILSLATGQINGLTLTVNSSQIERPFQAVRPSSGYQWFSFKPPLPSALQKETLQLLCLECDTLRITVQLSLGKPLRMKEAIGVNNKVRHRQTNEHAVASILWKKPKTAMRVGCKPSQGNINE